MFNRDASRSFVDEITAFFQIPLTETQKTAQLEKGFGSCLMTMDDNHHLPEWLAYQYTTLPLRRLIVFVDAQSRTSPVPILDRFRNLIKVTYITEEDMYLKETLALKRAIKLSGKGRVRHYLGRQNKFNAACLKQLQKEGFSWVTNIDTDEYIVFNEQANEDHMLPHRFPTVMEMMNDVANRKSSPFMSTPCLIMSRYTFGPVEEKDKMKLLDGFPMHTNLQVTDFYTYRWRYRQPIEFTPLPGKALVDLSRVWNTNDLDHTNAHALVRPVCNPQQQSLWKKGVQSPLLVNHYTGTQKQFTSRSNDARGSRLQEFWKRKQTHTGATDDSARGWLLRFMEQVGQEQAEALLEGAGVVERAPGDEPTLLESILGFFGWG